MNDMQINSQQTEGAVAVRSGDLLCVWECRRYKSGDNESWAGALLIAASDETTARTIYTASESWREGPQEVVKMEGVFAAMPPRVIYNDDMR